MAAVIPIGAEHVNANAANYAKFRRSVNGVEIEDEDWQLVPRKESVVMTIQGERRVPKALYTSNNKMRQCFEPGMVRFTIALGIDLVDTTRWPARVTRLVGDCVRSYDCLTSTSHQRFYRYGIFDPIDDDFSPSFVAVQAVKILCLRRRWPNNFEKLLGQASWMMDDDFHFTNGGRWVRDRNDPNCVAVQVKAVRMPAEDAPREKNLADRLNRSAPKYKALPGGSWTVSQAEVDGLRVLASDAERAACTDREEYDEDGVLLFVGVRLGKPGRPWYRPEPVPLALQQKQRVEISYKADGSPLVCAGAGNGVAIPTGPGPHGAPVGNAIVMPSLIQILVGIFYLIVNLPAAISSTLLQAKTKAARIIFFVCRAFYLMFRFLHRASWVLVILVGIVVVISLMGFGISTTTLALVPSTRGGMLHYLHDLVVTVVIRTVITFGPYLRFPVVLPNGMAMIDGAIRHLLGA